jgi:hypothetical protein
LIDLISKTCDNTSSLSEFCRELKRFEQIKMILTEYEEFYYEKKSQYILLSMGRELKNKLSMYMNKMPNHFNELSL